MNYRKWVWGTDRTEYIYPQSNNNKSRKRYYCRPALSKYYITNLKKYSDYDIINEPERTYYYRHSIIKWRAGHWKGNEEKHYYAGNISGPYSRKAISWLNRISKEKNIEKKIILYMNFMVIFGMVIQIFIIVMILILEIKRLMGNYIK